MDFRCRGRYVGIRSLSLPSCATGGTPMSRLSCFSIAVLLSAATLLPAQTIEPVDVEGQPLAANVTRILQALELLGSPLAADTVTTLQKAIEARDARKLQQLLD